MRWQMGEYTNHWIAPPNLQGKPAKSGNDAYIMEGLAQSPNGLWYPTTVRRLGAIRNADGTVHDQVFRFFLNFNAALPDSLFDGKGTEVKP